MRILISSAGRRVSLIECFRESFRRLGVDGGIVAADASTQAPARHFADDFRQTPRCDDPDFVPRLVEIAARDRIDLIVPTIDPELTVYARARDVLAQAGISVAISSSETIAICRDKRETHRWLCEHGFPVPRQLNLGCVVPANPRRATVKRAKPHAESPLFPLRFPVIVKPRRGSGSAGVRRVDDLMELQAVAAAAENNGPIEEYVVEEIAPGREHTINVFVDARGICLAAVPHRRIEVRAGEVSKAATVRRCGLIELARGIAETLPGARGPLSIQCFLAPGGGVQVTEINARFGGGYPLTHRSGARFTDWIVQQFLGIPISECDDWTADLTMLRYDREVFVCPESRAFGSDEQILRTGARAAV